MKVSLVSTNRDEDGVSKYSEDLLEELRNLVEIELIEINKPSSSSISYWKRLGKKANHGDLVHIQHEYGIFGNLGNRLHGIMILPFLNSLDSPIVTTLHSVERRSKPESFKTKKIIKLGLMRYIDRKLFSASDKLVVHSQSSKDILTERAPSEKIEVVPHGVRLKDSAEQEAAKKLYGLKGQKVVTLFGYIRRSKGYEKVLRAVKKLDHQVLIAGSAVNEEQRRYKQDLKDLACKLGIEERIQFTGYVKNKNVRNIMGATDLLVLPYDEITGSGVFTLGITYGVPMITSNLDYFREKEEKGLCDTFESNSDLASKIEEGPDVDTEKIDEYRRRNSWSSIAKRTSKLYEEVVE